ncbi:MAG: hypothetical protein ACREN5_16440, partial [Gemmatimonadales bacterium]
MATVPQGVVDGPISVATPNGTATSAAVFRAATFLTFGEEFNQGVPQYPGVAGKDALVRVFAGSSVGGWLVSDASLRVRAPSGAVVTVPPSMFSPVLTNPVQEFSERSNVNFYVPGAVLSETGAYDFTATVSTMGQTVLTRGFSATVTPTKDVVMVFQSLMRHPDQEEWRLILRAFDTFVRMHPVRADVGDLIGAIGADEPNAGLRVGYLCAPVLGDLEESGASSVSCPSQGCRRMLLDELEERLAIVNSGGFEATEFSTLFMPRDRLLTNGGSVVDCSNIQQVGAFGFARMNRPAQWVTLCNIVGSTLAHEVGHSMGLVPNGAPNSNGSGHSSTGNLPERAFNVLERLDVPNPIPAMFAVARAPEENTFFENAVGGTPVDYPVLVSQRRLAPGPVSLRDDARRFRGLGAGGDDGGGAAQPSAPQRAARGPRLVLV